MTAHHKATNKEKSDKNMSSYLCESHQSDRIMWNLKSHLRLYPFRGRFEDWDLVLGLNLERGLG